MELSSIPILGTAISIVIAWALFAILCSQINEAFAQLLAERGRFMRKYLLLQLKDIPNGINWASILYMHGTIDLLSREPGKPTNNMPSDLFAKAMIEIAGDAQMVQAKIPALPVPPNYKQQILNKFKAATLVLQPSAVVDLWIQAFTDAEAKAIQTSGVIDESLLYRQLVQNIADWHSQLMTRITLWYQKKTRQRLLILGVLLAICLNIDSIQLFSYFNSDAKARNTMIDFYLKNKNELETEANKYKADKLISTDSVKHDTSIAKKGITATANSTDSLKKDTGLVSISNDIIKYTTRLDSLQKAAQLPIGFSKSLIALPFKNKDEFLSALGISSNIKQQPTIISNAIVAILLKISGIIITGIAASFGAPFWFDLLKKVYTKN